MIDGQLRPSGVNAEYVLKRMGEVAREDYLPVAVRNIAYMDRAIALDNGGWLPAPLVQGMMLQEANPRPGDRVIVVDSGSGYLAALVRPLVREVTELSPQDALGAGGESEGATLLLIDGAAEQIPAPLLARLADGARIVAGTSDNGVTRLAVGLHNAGSAAMLPVLDLGIPPIAAFDKPKGWSF